MISFSASLPLIQRIATVCVLTLDPASLLMVQRYKNFSGGTFRMSEVQELLSGNWDNLTFFFICILFTSFSCLVALSKTLNFEQKCRRECLLVLLSVSEEMLSKCPRSQSVGCGPTSQSLLCWSVLRLLLCRDLVHCQRPVLHLLR